MKSIQEFVLEHRCTKEEQKLVITYLAFLRMKATLEMLLK